MEGEEKMLKAVLKAAGEYFESNLSSSKRAMRYAIERGLDEDIRRTFGIGYAPERRDYLFRHLKERGFLETDIIASGLMSKRYTMSSIFSDRIMIPIRNMDGEIVGFGGRKIDGDSPKYINSPTTAIYSKSGILFGMDIAKETQKAAYVIVEGYMDTMALHKAGITNAVGILGTALTEEMAAIIKKHKRKAVLMLDSDEAGMKAAVRSRHVLKTADIPTYICTLPEGYKDPDEYLKDHTGEEMRAIINASPTAEEYMASKIREDYAKTKDAALLTERLIEEYGYDAGKIISFVSTM